MRLFIFENILIVLISALTLTLIINTTCQSVNTIDMIVSTILVYLLLYIYKIDLSKENIWELP